METIPNIVENVSGWITWEVEVDSTLLKISTVSCLNTSPSNLKPSFYFFKEYEWHSY